MTLHAALRLVRAHAAANCRQWIRPTQQGNGPGQVSFRYGANKIRNGQPNRATIYANWVLATQATLRLGHGLAEAKISAGF